MDKHCVSVAVHIETATSKSTNWVNADGLISLALSLKNCDSDFLVFGTDMKKPHSYKKSEITSISIDVFDD